MSELCALESYSPKKPKEAARIRLEYFNSYQDGVNEAIKWAKSNSCRCFLISEKLAKSIYKGVAIVELKQKNKTPEKGKNK